MKSFFAGAFLSVFALFTAADARTIEFAGYEWEVRADGVGGPGPNNWADANVSVDAQGSLHMKLTQRSGKWYCSEVNTVESLGYGLYEFQVVGRVDALDPNIVLGLFDYPAAGGGPDGTNEIDIEFSRWGDATNPNVDGFTIYPSQLGPRPTNKTFPLTLQGAGHSAHTFDWSATNILFQSFGSFDKHAAPLVSWLFRPHDSVLRIPHENLPVHINLWLVDGKPPMNGQEVELIIRSFRFTPE